MSLFKEHKIVTVAVLVGVVGSAIGLGIINQPVEYQPSDVSHMTVESTKTTTKPKVEEVEEADATVAPQEVAPKRVVAEKPAEPKVLSTQEYANKYLSFSTPPQQECFDAIVAEWPERFVPSVREQNVKALRAWASLCASGIKTSFTAPTTVGHIYLYGENGEFFDSPQAKAYW